MASSPASAASESLITTFTLDVPQADLDDLRDCLARTRWPAPLPDGDWDVGVPVAYLRTLSEYWRDGYGHREEARLDSVPQFTTVIDGQRIHFLHVRSSARGRPATAPHPRLARLGGRVPGDHRASDQPRRSG
jgi:Epoxide hydrolase N terminus